MDIVERLKAEQSDGWSGDACAVPCEVADEAAEITALRKRVSDLEGAATTHARTLEALRDAEKALVDARAGAVSLGLLVPSFADPSIANLNRIDAALARIKETTDGR